MSTGAVVGAAARRAERKLVEHLKMAGAVSPTSTSTLPDLRWMGKRVLSRLIRADVIHEVQAGYYLDEVKYSAYRARRQKNTIAIMSVVVVAASLVIWWASRH